jgi:hypothetical protein
MPQLTSATKPNQRADAWTPILPPAVKAKALAAINGIVAALPEPSSANLKDPSLAAGAAGLALLCAYLSRAGMDDDENATQFLSKAICTISSEPMRPSLYDGFAGIAWVAAHLDEQVFDSDDEDPNAAIIDSSSSTAR